ncbi:MAG TPA: hypothetical protein VL728_06440 [Cyclobacteriaceae bacterium]|nr:hypothetical protein [Cyclobacteriaceae bacterium]
MEREAFNNLLNNFTSLTSDEARELAALARNFPYSQVIHNLAARAAQDNRLDAREKLLTISAIYSTDRSALKAMMTAPVKVRAEFRPLVKVENIPVTQPTDPKSNDLFLEQLMADLATMHESKKAFEEMIEKMETEKAFPLPTSKKEKVKPEPKAPTSTPGDLIEEIETTKKKIKPESMKLIEQNEIIDQFIKTQPSITRKPAATPPQTGDLSEPSGQFGENIVSETLVEILLKQGKKEKAIEALKKLIWKFPQKKAYFAAQIEELRK